MRIGFDTTALALAQTGVGTYTAGLFEHLQHNGRDEVVPLTHLRPGRRLNKTVWMQLVLPLELRARPVDVCHFTNHVAPLWTPCPTVVTVHDLTLWLMPRTHSRRRLLAMRPFIPLALRRAQAVIAVSRATQRDLVRLLGVQPEKVHVIPEAPQAHFRPMPEGQRAAARAALAGRYGLPPRFLLAVGTLEPRKNLLRLLDAYERLRANGHGSVGLALVGQRGWNDEAIVRALLRPGLRDKVRWLGYVPRDDLVWLYNLAEALVFPSLYEGFGLPVIEAMACGTPVVTSPNGGLSETAGDAAALVDPTSTDSIAEGITRVLDDPQNRTRLAARGLKRAAELSWARAAAQTRLVYEQAAAAAPRLARTAG